MVQRMPCAMDASCLFVIDCYGSGFTPSTSSTGLTKMPVENPTMKPPTHPAAAIISTAVRCLGWMQLSLQDRLSLGQTKC